MRQSKPVPAADNLQNSKYYLHPNHPPPYRCPQMLEGARVRRMIPAMPTPEEERIAGVYSGMSDEELRRIAQSGDELSEVAADALQAEIVRRRLEIVVVPPPGFDVPELNETVTLRRFRDLPEALIARGSLESAGIQAYLVDDNMIRMDWFYSNLLGGVKLKVPAEDVEAAAEILNQPIPDTIEVEGVGNYEQPKCPECQSLDISYLELTNFSSHGTADAVIPNPAYKHAWNCNACGHEWGEPESGESAARDSELGR